MNRKELIQLVERSLIARVLFGAVALSAGACSVAGQTAGAAVQLPTTANADKQQGEQGTPAQNGAVSKEPSLSQAPAAVTTAVSTAVSMPPAVLHRKRIGLALGGGGALALSEIGVLRWFDENHIPVDAIAGTSMGALVGSLYATGHTPAQMTALTSDKVFATVFRLDQDFRQLNYRRREDARFVPGGFHLGLKHGVSFRNGVLLDYGLNQFLSAQFLPYGAGYDFDNLPVPFRCVATDILVGREAVFNQGPLAEAVRASISIPGVFPPLADGGHIYVDGALTENLPTDLVKNALHADVVLAVSLPLTPPDKGDTNSLLGILGRSFSVAAWSNEVRSRGLADVLIEPMAPTGVGAADYAKAEKLADAGYAAAEQMRAKLLVYRLADAEWATYVAERKARSTGRVGNIAKIQVTAPSPTTAYGVGRAVASLAGKPLRPADADGAENEIRSDGRYDANYFLSKPGAPLDLKVTGPANQDKPSREARELLHPQEKRGPGDDLATRRFGAADPAEAAGSADAQGARGQAISGVPVNNTLPVGRREDAPLKDGKKNQFETVAPGSDAPMYEAVIVKPGYTPQPEDAQLNVLVRDKAYGPPFLLVGGNVIAQSGGTARATIDSVLTAQDFGGYRSELRTRLRFGFLTEVEPEYQRRVTAGGMFAAPRAFFYRAPVYIYANQKRVAERSQILAGGGFDLGYTVSHYTEVRAGWHAYTNRWHTTTGGDGLPDMNGHVQEARVLYRFNGQDRALIPRHGLRLDVSGGVQYATTGSQTAPKVMVVGAYFRDIGHGNTLSLSGEGGTFGHRTIADPFRWTLGGPLRLAASAYDEYRGTDYLLVRPAYFRRIASLPAPLGQSMYVVGTYEFGQVFAPNAATVTRQDFFLGLAAETPIGAITFGEAVGTDNHRKTVFTLGRFF